MSAPLVGRQSSFSAPPLYSAGDHQNQQARMDGKIEILGQEWLSQGFMKLAKFTVQHQRFAGSMIGPFTREIVVRTIAVGVLPYDPVADKFLLIEQFRLAAHLGGMPA